MSDEMDEVVVRLSGRAYPICIGRSLLADLGRLLRLRCGARRATVVTDSNVGSLYAGKLGASFDAAAFEHELITVPAGDASKCLARLSEIHDRLAVRRHDRGEPVIALGGGMVGDLAGLAAATWLRGVPFVQCPTTLEADVDASVGGKTAINHPAGKNLIGAFHQPILVCIDVDCLATLERRDYVAGLAESVKHAVIRDEPFFRWHEANREAIRNQTPAVVRELIRRNCQNKAAVVVADEREEAGIVVGHDRTEACGTSDLPWQEGAGSKPSAVEAGEAGIQGPTGGRTGEQERPGIDAHKRGAGDRDVGRAALNFGHTIGHAIEAQAHFELRHGECVSLGMVAAMDLAVRCCGFSEDHRARVERLLADLGLPIRATRPIDAADVLSRLTVDKKARDRTVRFIVPTALGRVRWLESPDASDVQQAISRLMLPV